MGHVDADALAFPHKNLRQVGTEFRTVNVPVNAPDRFEGFEPIQYFGSPEIARVPHLVAFCKVPEDRIVQKPVGVGEEPDPHDFMVSAPGSGRERGTKTG
jgi:hypothetical protein